MQRQTIARVGHFTNSTYSIDNDEDDEQVCTFFARLYTSDVWNMTEPAAPPEIKYPAEHHLLKAKFHDAILLANQLAS